MSRPTTPASSSGTPSTLSSRAPSSRVSSPSQALPLARAVTAALHEARTEEVQAAETTTARTADVSPLITTSSATWVPVDATPLRNAYSETLAHRMHAVFQYTAIPTGIVIGLFLVALLFQDLVEAHSVGRVISLYCALMSVGMTGLLIYLHMAAYTNPPQQRYIVRILLMVPIYAVDSCLAIWDHSLAPVIGLLRDCYESYVIYNFFHLLMSYLGGEEQALASRLGVKMSHMFPFCCLPPFQVSARTFRMWKLLLLQYMLLKPFVAVVAILLTPSGAFEETSWSFSNAHVYFVLILNVSVTLAFTTLVYFFVEYRDLLTPHQPMGKFAAVKAVVFLSFWQGVLMGILVHIGVIKESKQGLWNSDQVSTGLQDFLICIEMLLMCYLHHRVFPETPYVPLCGHQPVKSWVWRHVFSVSDVVDDSVDTVQRIADTVAETENAKVV